MRGSVNIVVVNHSKKITAHELSLMVGAVAYQLHYHCAPAWERVCAPVYIALDDAHTHPSDVVIGIFDNADAADALGYHDETPTGHKYGKVFVNPILESGGKVLGGALSVSATLSHEVLEAFIDAPCNIWSDEPNGGQVAEEVGDPVEADGYVIPVTDKTAPSGKTPVYVSNFVLPAWFDDEAPAGSKFDHMGTVHAAFTMSAGGYMIVRSKLGTVSQVFGENYPEHKRPGKLHPAARSARRMAP